MSVISDPKLIEGKSFEIISGLLPDLKLPYAEKEVLKRVIHATTELNYVKDLIFHPQAVKAGLKAIKEGKDIICDVSMVEAGINRKALSGFGGKVICLINDKDVIKKSAELKIARAILSMRKAAVLMKGAIVAIGNAPTALFELCDLVRKNKASPALIIGVPVGFVGAVESKRALTLLKTPHITNKSTKGGSSVAAAVTNALLKLAKEG
ncbi:MAG: precorrin-8X methylmutase [Candidatus Omnitrophota bacterium]